MFKKMRENIDVIMREMEDVKHKLWNSLDTQPSSEVKYTQRNIGIP